MTKFYLILGALLCLGGCAEVDSSTDPPATTSSTTSAPTITPGCGSCLSTPCHMAYCFDSGCQVVAASDGTPCGANFACKGGKCEAL